MNNTVRVSSNMDVRGSLALGLNASVFPDNPSLGTMILKDGVLYGYQMLGGLATWYPLTNQSQSYIHTQGLAALEWTVHHELNNAYSWFQVQDAQGHVIMCQRELLDANTFKLFFTEPTEGYCVVVAPDSLSVPEVRAANLIVDELSVANGKITMGPDGATIDGSPILTVATGGGLGGGNDSRIGDLANLLTTNKTLIVAAINELTQSVSGNQDDISALTSLTSNLVTNLSSEISTRTQADADIQQVLLLKADAVDVPSKVSQLDNDLNFQTLDQIDARIEALIDLAPTTLDTFGEIATQMAADETALASLVTTVGTKADKSYVDSQLSSRVLASSLALVATTGQYSDLLGKPTLVSQFTNDAGYQTSAQVDTKVATAVSTINSQKAYASFANFPAANTMPGATALAQDTDVLYMSTGDAWVVIYTSGSIPYDIAMNSYGSPPATGNLMASFTAPRAVAIKAGASGVASCNTAPTGTMVFTLRHNGVDIGTVTFAATSLVGVVSIASDVALASASVLSMVNTSANDATMKDISLTLKGLV